MRPQATPASVNTRHLHRQRPVEVVAAERAPEREPQFGIGDGHAAADQAIERRARAVELHTALAGLERTGVVAAHEARVAEIERRQPPVFGVRGRSVRNRSREARSCTGGTASGTCACRRARLIRQRSRALRELEPVAASADRARHAEDRRVVDERADSPGRDSAAARSRCRPCLRSAGRPVLIS